MFDMIFPMDYRWSEPTACWSLCCGLSWPPCRTGSRLTALCVVVAVPPCQVLPADLPGAAGAKGQPAVGRSGHSKLCTVQVTMATWLLSQLKLALNLDSPDHCDCVILKVNSGQCGPKLGAAPVQGGNIRGERDYSSQQFSLEGLR